MRVTPDDFSSITPPPRTIGIECEYNLQQTDSMSCDGGYQILTSSGMNAHDVRNHNGYLGSDNGSGRAYPDVGHLEFDTAEAMGPASAAVQDLKGINYISDIVTKSGHPHNGMYRIAGSYIKNGRFSDTEERSSAGRSSGYHENYLLPRSMTNDQLLDMVLPTMLASRGWAMHGTLRQEGFVLSQKVWGIGGAPVERTLNRRTTHGKKPMILIPPLDVDANTIGSEEWARAEVRLADPGLSLVNRFLGFAAVSLTLRLIELQHIVGRKQLEASSLRDPVAAAKLFAADLTFRKQAETQDGEMVTSIAAQEILLGYFSKLSKEVKLPEEEVFAIDALRGVIDELRASVPVKGDYTKLASMRMEFAPQHQFISKGQPIADVTASSEVAMQRNLLWDRALPEGNGMRYWSRINTIDPMAAQVQAFADRSGLAERAKFRASIIDGDIEGEVVNWAKYRDKNSELKSLGPPIGD